MTKKFSFLFLAVFLSIFNAYAQVSLTGNSYTETFDGLGTGLPIGWTVRTGANSSTLGTEETFNTDHKTWNATAAGFRNCGSNDGTNDSNNTDRALALRQSGSFGDPGAAFTAHFTNTSGLESFQLSFKLQSLNSTSIRTTEWQVQWASGANPTVFNTVICSPTFNTTGGSTISNTTVSCFLPASIEDINEDVWIRIIALNSTTGSGMRVTSGIDDFELTYNTISPTAPKLKINSAFNSFAAIENSPSAAQPFIFSAVNLTDTAKVFAPSGFEIAMCANCAFGDSLKLLSDLSGIIADTTLQLRLKGTIAGTFNGNILATSTGANDLNVPLSGVVNSAITGISSIASIKTRTDGDPVSAAGRVTVGKQFGGNQIFIQDSTGGISIYKFSGNLVYENGLEIGDSVQVEGTKGSFGGLSQINATQLNKINTAAIPPVPLVIDLNDVLLHEGELVRLTNLQIPGVLALDGQRNYTFEPMAIRISSPSNSLGYANPLVGSYLAPAVGDVIGIAGRYYDSPQILPRLVADIISTGPPIPGATDQTFEDDNTLDVVAWNLEWFGSPNYEPNDDTLQNNNVKNVIKTLNADLFTFTEVANLAKFQDMVAELNTEGFAYADTCSSRLSYDDNGEDGQRICFLYKPALFSNIVAKHVFESLDDSLSAELTPNLLSDFPDSTKSRFWASGRLPFTLTADVNFLNQPQQTITFVGIHARANTSSQAAESLSKYNMRKFDLEALHDSLALYYPNRAIIALGDFNDDLDFTVATAAGVPQDLTSYEAFVNDTTYILNSKALSEAGKKSTVGFSDMIDHLITNTELTNQYIPNSVRVGNPEAYIASYGSTTSDHYPVMARFNLKSTCTSELQLTSAITSGIQKEEAGYSIEASNTISGGANVIYDANNSILLEPGFEISAHDTTVFKAVIDGCGGD